MGRGAVSRPREHRCAVIPRARRHARAFTLVELLVTIAIVITLIALLLPALARGIASARAFRCQVSLRTVAFDFRVFADPQTSRARGDDDQRYGRGRFSLETFIESEYGVDEFWDKNDPRTMIERSDRSDPLRCAEVAGPLQLRRNVPCRSGAIGPAENVSYTFNSRLFRIETIDSRGRPRTREATLTPDVAARGLTPLVWDVDGPEAGRRGVTPHWSAPALDSRSAYARDRLWFPGFRHAGQGNFALIDGSVHSASDPLTQPGWRWEYQPRP